jgi:hypothetical protein
MAASSSLESPRVTLESLPSNVLGAVMAQCDARSLCALSLACRSLAAAAREEEPLLYCELVRRRYGPLEWAMPAGALEPARADGWRVLYYSLGRRGSDGHWGRLVVGTVTHESLVRRGLSAASEYAGCVLLIDEAVYDVTRFAPLHPGMAASLHLFNGTDASEPFHDVSHSQDGIRMMGAFRIDALSLPAEPGLPASQLTDEEYDAWHRRAADTDIPRLLPLSLAGSLPTALCSRLVGSEQWQTAARRAGSVLQLLRAPNGATGHRRHDALFAAGLYQGLRPASAAEHVAGGSPAGAVGWGEPGECSVRWWLPFTAGAAWRDAFAEDEEWW